MCFCKRINIIIKAAHVLSCAVCEHTDPMARSHPNLFERNTMHKRTQCGKCVSQTRTGTPAAPPSNQAPRSPALTSRAQPSIPSTTALSTARSARRVRCPSTARAPGGRARGPCSWAACARREETRARCCGASCRRAHRCDLAWASERGATCWGKNHKAGLQCEPQSAEALGEVVAASSAGNQSWEAMALPLQATGAAPL